VLVGLLTACGDSAALVPGRRVHTSLAGSGPDSTLAHALIDMYCRCGSVAEAESVFFGALAPEAAAAAAAGRWDTVVACNTMLAGYARHGAARRVFDMLDSMLKEGGGGDRITLLNALAACAHCGLVAEAQQLFCSAVLLTGTCAPLGIEHHHCMADLLGRAGRPLEASGTLQRMPFSPDPVTWRTALSASAAARFPFGIGDASGASGAGGGAGLGLPIDAWLESVPSDEPECSGGLLVLMSNILAQQEPR
jgi:pentatricopeptide repeat protein